MKLELVHLADENSQLTLKTRENDRDRDRDRDRETEASCHLLGAGQRDCSMSPLTSFHRIAHDTFSSFLLSLVHSLSL